MLEFSRPIWLLLLLALPAIVWLALRMSYASLGPYQKWISLGLRIIIWLLLVGALAGVQFVRLSDRVSVVVALDSSDSIDDTQVPAVEAALEEARKTMKKDDTLGRVYFGADALLEFLPVAGPSEQTRPDEDHPDARQLSPTSARRCSWRPPAFPTTRRSGWC